MYSVKVENFEGPLDLLLFFIKRDELDIYDIPISRITAEFLEYVRLMELLDLELAGEFLVMASTLMQIKAKMLLPKEETLDPLADEDDPRAELVRRLLEYKRYKEMAQEFQNMEQEQRYAYYRKFFKADVRAQLADDSLNNVTLFHLLSAFKRALEKAPRESKSHNIEQINLTVEEQAEHILHIVSRTGNIAFLDLTQAMPRITIVITFLALLELLRAHAIEIHQETQFDDLLILHRTA